MKGQNADFVVIEYSAREIVHSRIFAGNVESQFSINIVGTTCIADIDAETILRNYEIHPVSSKPTVSC
jgi:hypothetical protein